MLDRIYEYAISRRNKRFDSQKTKIYSSIKPIISVGNITTGGTGKSPFVQAIALYYKRKNFRVAIVGRGYRRKSKGFLLVSDGKTILTDVHNSGDELYMHALALPDCTIIADESRTRAVQWIENNNAADIIILDDGFQHRFIDRDIDIVLIDHKTILGSLLPFGNLREPHSSIQRADILCFSNSITQIEVEQFLEKNNSIDIPYFRYCTKFSCWRKAWTNIQTDMPNTPITTVSSIANPERFFYMMENEGISIQKKCIYKDHYFFTQKDIEKIISTMNGDAKFILMTAKDEVKLSDFKEVFSNNSIQCIVADIQTYITDYKDFFTIIDKKIQGKIYDNSVK